jgi:deoxyribodipyrimidine photo-lyase
MHTMFDATPEAAEQRLAAVQPGPYARTRNHVEGAVTGLSPYLTHGFLTMPDVLARLRQRFVLPLTHKLVFELGWREYFHHAWRHEGDAIFESLHEGMLPDAAYARELPPDIARAATGVPVVDEAVRTLYATGYLHNHARMWLASYTVHLRKVHWRVGADWMFVHLLDGDLASNHLSWQWVAGTGSSKPYLFNAENVARYAPPAWHSAGTVVDQSYEQLDAIARTLGVGGKASLSGTAAISSSTTTTEPVCQTEPPAAWGFAPPRPEQIAGHDVWLLHPWSLATPPPGATVVAVLNRAFHQRWPWSLRRWAFVAQRMASITPLRWIADAPALAQALAAARSVRGVHNPHLGNVLGAGDAFAPFNLIPMPRAFADPPQRCRSFSAFWSKQAAHPALQGELWT